MPPFSLSLNHSANFFFELVLFCFEYWNIIISAIDAPGGFLFEWWSVFWDIFIARTNEKHSEVAASYIEVCLTFSCFICWIQVFFAVRVTIKLHFQRVMKPFSSLHSFQLILQIIVSSLSKEQLLLSRNVHVNRQRSNVSLALAVFSLGIC